MAEVKMTVTLDQITRFFASFERRELQKPHLKNAAVLMLFYPKDDDLHVLLTKRTDEVEHHKGQISFPGGSRDEDDDNLVRTALRESEEEIGLPQDAVQVLGIYDDFETPSGFAITPVVAYAHFLPPLCHNSIEVAEILEVPVSMFLDKRNERIEKQTRFGTVLDVYFYRYGAYEIWGATAAILRAFLNALRASQEE
jgi:8-oxo-dGTP pyrophosphatase MutT (NUDIX family)